MTKRIPNLQVALDHSDLQGAIKAAVSVGHEVDIIEAGTVCLLQVGSELVEVLRSLFPDKIIVADTKCADAGGTVAKNNAVRGADWMTCICCGGVLGVFGSVRTCSPPFLFLLETKTVV